MVNYLQNFDRFVLRNKHLCNYFEFIHSQHILIYPVQNMLINIDCNVGQGDITLNFV